MRYEINVALNGHHFFATAERSLTYLNIRNVLVTFMKKFPSSEGYSISVTEYKQEGDGFTATQYLTEIDENRQG